jgi:hypothetical protein
MSVENDGVRKQLAEAQGEGKKLARKVTRNIPNPEP